MNNAANLEFRAVEETDDDQARAQIETLVIAPARLARLAIAHMRERGEGRILMVTSMSVTLSMPFHGWYQAGKRALAGVSDALRMEVADSGISVIQVEPGAFRTGMTAELVGAAVPRGSRYTRRYERGQERIRSTSRYWRDPAHVAGVIADALTARSPRPRYLVGYDAMIATLLETVIPKRAGDAIKRLFYP